MNKEIKENWWHGYRGLGWRRPFWNWLPRNYGYAYNSVYSDYPNREVIVVKRDNELEKNNALLKKELNNDHKNYIYIMVGTISFVILIIVLMIALMKHR
jgi:hypothetical protein